VGSRSAASVSLIVTTYNWPEALDLTLQSVLAQSRAPDEVLIADDGSAAETARTVERVLGGTDLRWRHVRHEDRGVRQSRIKNLAVKFSSGSYLILIDHDVVLHPRFVEDHLRMSREGVFLQGKRLLLPKFHTDAVLAGHRFDPPGFWTKGIGNRKNLLRFPALGVWFSRTKRFEQSLRGCNLSLSREDFMRVDGFDETFDGSWGREDSDFCYRLFHAGVMVRVLWFMALQYHLFHPVMTNWSKERLDGELDRNLREKRIKALQGYSSLTSEGDVVAGSF
jgi:glycosyltransferase involved in cell wall biosynthesis